MSNVKLIPSEMLSLIPLYGGDKRMLNLFLRKCEYIIGNYKGVNNQKQDVYVMHAITSRLTGDAAALISQCEDDPTWEEFKALLIQHFGDHRTEDSIATELDNLQFYPGETYAEFYNRILSIRAVLLAKVNESNSSCKDLKISMYNSKALDVFLFCLPEYLLSLVRQKTPKTLEEAYKIVDKELNFYEQYNLKKKGRKGNFRCAKSYGFPSVQIPPCLFPLFENFLDHVAPPYYTFINPAPTRPSGGGPLFKFSVVPPARAYDTSQAFDVPSAAAAVAARNAQPQEGPGSEIPPENHSQTLPMESNEQMQINDGSQN